MPRAHDASDADLVARVARGDHAALDALLDRYADAVHDHVARWTGDARVAADATTTAFVTLLDDVRDGTAPTAVLAVLLHAARTHALTALEGMATRTAPIPAAVLGAAGTAGPTPGAARAAWSTAEQLGSPLFSVLDLHVRRRLDGHELGSVLGLPTASVDDLLATLDQRTDTATRADYGGLTTLPAPVASRTAVTAAATDRFGRPGPTATTLGTRIAVVIAGLSLVVVGVAFAGVLDRRTATPVSGPATAAAEAVPSPSAAASPGSTESLSPRPSPSVVPMASPEPTVPVSPSPSPAPSPTPTPTPTPTVLTVRIDAPTPGATFAATQQQGDRQVATVPVSATIAGGSDDTLVTWTSDLAPDETLLDGATGDVVLFLQSPCLDTAHTLTVTATDEPSGQLSQATVDVLVAETCEEPLDVTILEPSAGQTIDGTLNADGTHTATIDVLAEATDEDLVWTWSVSNATLVRAPEGPSGRLELRLDGCTLEREVSVTVEVRRPADESTANADPVTVRINCPIG